MDILTVANESYVLHALNLFLSYEKYSFNKNKVLYYFNIKDSSLNFLSNKVNNLKLIEIPKLNDWIYNTKIFLFKAYALSNEIKNSNGFIYSDSANCFVRKDDFLESYFIENERLLLQYPEEIKKNKFFTTKKCFKLLDCDSEFFKNKKQYWAGLQAYKPTKNNIKLLNDQLSFMLNKDAAFPEANVERPDGSSSDALCHRNDQSILSLLIEKYNLGQDFNYKLFNYYGDFYTVFEHDINFLNSFNKLDIIIHARDAKKNGLRFITQEILEQYKNLK